MTGREGQSVTKLARLLYGIHEYDEAVPNEIWEPAHLFFSAKLPMVEIADVMQTSCEHVAEGLRKYLRGLLAANEEFRQVSLNLLRAGTSGADVEAGTSASPAPPERLAEALLGAMQTHDPVGGRVQEILSSAMELWLPAPPAELNREIILRLAKGTAEGETGGSREDEAAPGAADPASDDSVDRHEYEGVCRKEFLAVFTARETGHSDRASKLIYGVECPEEGHKPDPRFAVLFVREHLRQLEGAIRDDLPEYPGTRLEKVVHKSQTVNFGLMCFEVAAGAESFDAGLWVGALAEGMCLSRRSGAMAGSALVLQCSQDSEDLLFEAAEPAVRRSVLRRILRNIGTVVALAGGSWRDLSRDMQKEQAASGPREKRVWRMHRALRECRRKACRIHLAGPGVLLPASRELEDFGRAIVLGPQTSRYCRASQFMDVCGASLSNAGLTVTVQRIKAGDEEAFSAVLGGSRPFFAYVEGSDHVDQISRGAWRAASKENRDTFLVHEMAMARYRPPLAGGTMSRTDGARRGLAEESQEEERCKRPLASPRVVPYVEEALPRVMYDLLFELPEMHLVDIEMSDEKGTLAKVVAALYGLDCNIVASYSRTIATGGLARLQVVVELPPALGWARFRTAMSGGLTGIGKITAHEPLFQPSLS